MSMSYTIRGGWRVDHYLGVGRLRMFNGDGSERCVVCGSRYPPNYYVGQTGMWTEDDNPERFPVCGDEHAIMWMKHVFIRDLDEGGYAF